MAMFVDQVKVNVKAGNGGNGIVSFRHEKYVAYGGPFGGDGGKGGDVIFEADPNMITLMDLRYHRKIKATPGENGKTKKMHGANGEDTIVKVPLGTIVKHADTGQIVADLTQPHQKQIVAHGGRGGRGNYHFKSSRNTAPKYAEDGKPGEEFDCIVELRVLADVGLVGFPSVGKSTFLDAVSRAHPEIGDYPFTTRAPNVGVVETKDGRSFILADLPGLIEGASQGEGRGDKFLRQIEITKEIAHVIDMAGVEDRDPYDDYILINKELGEFNEKLLKKPMIIIANKMDLESAKENLKIFKEKVKDKKIFEVSGATGQGLKEVVNYLGDVLRELPEEELYDDDKIESHVLYKFKKEEKYTITREDDVWVIHGDEIEKLFKMTKFSSEEAIYRFARKLTKMGIDKKLEELGAKEGDQVRILNFYFDYHN